MARELTSLAGTSACHMDASRCHTGETLWVGIRGTTTDLEFALTVFNGPSVTCLAWSKRCEGDEVFCHRDVSILVVAAFCMGAISCSHGDDTKSWKQMPLTPVKGTVHVDGQPAANVKAFCFPAGKLEERQQFRPFEAFTDENGVFHFAWKGQGDGIPRTKYHLIFCQYVADKTTGRRDVFGEVYNDRKKPFKTFIVGEEELDLGTYELETQKLPTGRKDDSTKSDNGLTE